MVILLIVCPAFNADTTPTNVPPLHNRCNQCSMTFGAGTMLKEVSLIMGAVIAVLTSKADC